MPTWMVVEDEPDIYDVLLAMFEIWGIDGVAFVNGEDAVAWLNQVDRGNAVGELPELAILDIRLPEMQGPEVAEHLRNSERLHDIAIVMITAYRLSPSAEEGVIQQAQADALMYKPLPAMPELRAKLDKFIALRKERTASTVTAAIISGANSDTRQMGTTNPSPTDNPPKNSAKAEPSTGLNSIAKPNAPSTSNPANPSPSTTSTGTDSGHAKP